MRLGQLARKLSISQSNVVEFLTRNNIPIETDSNARISDEHTTLVIQHFNPALLLAEPEKESITNELITPVPEEERQEKIQQEDKQEIAIETTSPQIETAEEKIELIKASKAELPGLKVLGKIELPEFKKKEEPKITEGESVEPPPPPIEVPTPSRRISRPEPRKNFRDKREQPWKNPLEAKREREAREAEQRRREQIEIEKELRTKHYQQKVKKGSQPTRSFKKVDEPLEEIVNDDRPTPRTWLGKFMRWLSTP
jgi:hypothetical protein